ncbi:DUF72 domain-containing protein [Bradyrhizobium sp. 62B]|uniref:DUF72 domain-containing protein n=1 Tax=Bradyrhizobium sp. 62B TaxID=2898442 RepID=UPI0035DDDA5E
METAAKPHRRSTYEKCANATPDDFRFSVKVPKSVSHSSQLARSELYRFIEESAGLGAKLGVFLVQFATSQNFRRVRRGTPARHTARKHLSPLVCEPRHESWFMPEVDTWLGERRISRVAADPARVPDAGLPGGRPGLRYF